MVPSPEPLRIRELRTIELCVNAGVLVVCAGGGGIPIVSGDHGFVGVEAVIDKDRTAALLATGLRADKLLLLTDVPAVYQDWPEPKQLPLRTASVSALRKLDLDPARWARRSRPPAASSSPGEMPASARSTRRAAC